MSTPFFDFLKIFSDHLRLCCGSSLFNRYPPRLRPAPRSVGHLCAICWHGVRWVELRTLYRLSWPVERLRGCAGREGVQGSPAPPPAACAAPVPSVSLWEALSVCGVLLPSLRPFLPFWALCGAVGDLLHPCGICATVGALRGLWAHPVCVGDALPLLSPSARLWCCGL